MTVGGLSPERWEQVQEILHSALDRNAADRVSFLEEACADDPELLREVVSLIGALDGAGPVGAMEHSARMVPAIEWIGPYRVLRPLGQGGMGTVYLAEREGAGFTQKVALKLLRAGFADPHLSDRLLGERRILARLEHPGIARLIDGGATPEGHPYFAMEYVEGLNLLEYCEQNRLLLSDRLQLFLGICEPVHYAHQQLIVHRDLKPSNIIVPDDGHPKLLDFGIAKLLDPAQGLEGATLTMPCFTPSYASPEQVRGKQVGTPSDIYSLGILLYELLAGRLPYQVETPSPAEIERIVCDTVPERPSVRAVQRRMRRLLSGDLDTIVLKALSKEPSRRYASVEQLAEDVRRHLDGRPVLARPDSIVYRTSKFIGRHRTGVAAAALVAVSLVTGTLAAGWQAQRATEQRDLAKGEAEKAALITNLMVDLFRLSDPTATLGDTVTARQLLDRGVDRIETEFGDQPDVQAEILAEVAKVYANLGLISRAESLAHQSLDLRGDLYGPMSLEVSQSLSQLGRLHATQGQSEQAIENFRRAIEIREAQLASPDTTLAQTQADLAWQLRSAGEHQEAAELFTRALETQRSLLGDERPEVASTLFGLAATYHDQGSFDEAEEVFQNALANYDTSLGKPHPLAATALINIGMIRRLREQYASAELLLSSAVSMRIALYEPNHPEVIEAISQWGIELHELGRYTEAERVLRDGLRRADNALGYKHPLASTMREELASIMTATGRYQEAITRFDTSLAAKRERLGDDHPQIVFALMRSAQPLIASGRYSAAEARINESLAMGERLSPGSLAVSDLLALHGLARIEIQRRKYATADSLLEEALAIADEQLRPNHRYRLALERDRAVVLLEWGRVPEAVRLLERVLQNERVVRPEPHPRIGTTLQLLGEAYLYAGEPERTEEILRTAEDNLHELPGWHWQIGTVKSLRGAALLELGRADDARQLLEEGHAVIRSHLGSGARAAQKAAQRLALMGEMNSSP